MKAASTILVMLFMPFACSSSATKMDGGAGDTADADAASTYDTDGDANDVGSAEAGGDADTGDSDSHRQPLCDGEQHLRLWVLVGGGGPDVDGSYVRIENGSPVLAIDGTCAFWIGGGWSEDPLGRDRPFRVGRLSETEIRSIEGALPLEDLAAIADCVPNVTIPDGPTFLIRTATASASCGGVTSPSKPGTRFNSAWMILQMVARNLWETGTPMDGALHVSAVRSSLPSTPSSPPAYAWPIAAALDSFLLADADRGKNGVSRLVDDPDAATALRAMRDQYLADRMAQPGLYANWDGLKAIQQNGVANVFMRDALPYEDAKGLLKF